MTKVYNKLGSVIIEQDGKDKVYLNPDDIRLVVSGEIFLINDAQYNRTYQLAKYDNIADGSGNTFGSMEECESYLLGIMQSSIAIDDGGSEPAFMAKTIDSNDDGTRTIIKWFSSTDTTGTPIKTQEIIEGNPSNPDIVPEKRIVITNSY